jgi:ADP-heptose:LPS heptosyltransferase
MQEKENSLDYKTIVISRTDSIGDVILTLPLCAWIKEKYPTAKIIFLGKKYTQPILECFDAIDEIHFWDEIESQPEQGIISSIKSWNAAVFVHVFPNKRIAKLVRKAKVPIRIGTSHRAYHLLTCNVRPSFTRRKSELHEAQLNFKLLSLYRIDETPTLRAIRNWVSAFKPKQSLLPEQEACLSTERKKVILHPKSQGSAVEWPMQKYIELAEKLVERNYRVFFSGTEKEGLLFRNQLPKHPEIIDVSGKLTLGQFIAFIEKTDRLVACSTGPLHIAAILGKKAIGLYTNIRPMHPGRWMPMGDHVDIITSEKRLQKPEEEIQSIEVTQLIEKF